MASWLTKRLGNLFGPARPSDAPYVWKKGGVLRAAQDSAGGRGRFGKDSHILTMGELSDSAKKVYRYLSRIADAQGVTFQCLRTIAARTKLSQSTVGTALSELETVGLVESSHSTSRRGGSSNLYRIRKVAEVFPDIGKAMPPVGEPEA